jgi:SPP1 family predicted phage head-tail adaptor
MASPSANPIGALGRRLVLEQPVATPDGAGGVTITFEPLATVWAEVRWLSGDERFVAGRPEQASRHVITLRWRGDVTAGMRFVGDGAVFGIVSAGDPAGDRRRLACQCEEISP